MWLALGLFLGTLLMIAWHRIVHGPFPHGVSKVGLMLRRAVGWSSLLIGVLGLLLPVLPGVPFLVAGVVLVGRRQRLVRRIALGIKLQLRRWIRQSGLRGWLGAQGWRVVREVGRHVDHVPAWLGGEDCRHAGKRN